jgi:hypothetical protein
VISALGRQRHAGRERVGSAEERPDVSRIRDLPESQHDVMRTDGQVRASIDAHDPRRVPERRYLGEQLGKDVLPRDEEFDGLDPGARGRLDEILALDGEEPRLLTLLARREKLPDEPELVVLARLDQAASESASFARSATAANACGSLTAMSASDLRSSSIPAFLTPSMKRL